VEVVPRSSYRRIWSLLGEARVSIGVSFSDGLPNSLIEAMIMGAFPVQTDPGGATAEWIEDGVNGLLVPPDDPEAIAAAVVEALGADDMVDAAVNVNRRLAFERADEAGVRERVVAAYRRVLETAPGDHGISPDRGARSSCGSAP
jgi:glycosyltransferase involved in cell wall biosynthesis